MHCKRAPARRPSTYPILIKDASASTAQSAQALALTLQSSYRLPSLCYKYRLQLFGQCAVSRALARTCATHELENVNTFAGAFLWDYLDALFTYNYHVTTDNVAHHLTFGLLALMSTAMHLSIIMLSDIYPLA